MQPFNYQLQVQDPFKSVLGALQLGEGIRSMEATRQQAALAQQREQQAFQAVEKLHSPNATIEDYRRASLLVDKDKADNVRQLWTQRSEAENRDDLNFTGQVFSAFRAGKPAIAREILDTKIAALENSGKIESANALKVWRNVSEADPQSAEDFFGTTLPAIPGGERVLEGALKLTEAGKPEEGFRMLTAKEVADERLPPGSYQRNNKTGKIESISKGPLVVVETGSKFGPVPEGMERYTDDAGVTRQRVIPGSKLEIDQMQEAAKVRGRKEQLQRAGGTVVQDLQRALTIVETVPGTTGRQASITLSLPDFALAETQTQAAKAFVESALSNVGLDTLQTMRENSPTGGALGQVPIQQQQRLEQVLGSLDLTQRKEVVQDNLRRVINIYMDIIHGSPPQINKRFESGEISANDRDAYAFRYKLSFDEFGKPLRRDGRRQDVRPDAPTRDAPSQRSITVEY